MKSLRQALASLKAATATFDEIQRSRAVDMLKWEHDELRHVFALLVLGSATGLPSPPVEISLGLLPEMEDDILLMLERLDTAHSPLSKLFSTLPVD